MAVRRSFGRSWKSVTLGLTVRVFLGPVLALGFPYCSSAALSTPSSSVAASSNSASARPRATMPGIPDESAPAAVPAAFTIVLDPGHGGSENGAEGKTGAIEKEITLEIAKRLRTLLAGEAGLSVLLTRDDDAAVGLDERTALANQNHADLFLSIHVNSAHRPDARGAETYFLSFQAKDEEIRTLAALENNSAAVDRERMGEVPPDVEFVLWDLAQAQYLEESSALAQTIQKELNEALGIKDRGVKQAPFRVLMGATMPAVLVEVGFVSNPAEEASLKTDDYRDRIAQALARALKSFVPEAKRRHAAPVPRVR